MGDRNLRDTGLADWLRRLPHYLYVADLIAGKQVLEIGCGSGEGAKFLADHGAARVVGVDARSARIEQARRRHTAANLSFRHEDLAALEFREHSFDAVFVPDGAALVKRPALMRELRRILMPSGVVVVVAPSADRGPEANGLSFHQLKDALSPLFNPVRLVAQTPLVAMGLVEYADDDSGQVALDTSLIEWTRAPEGSVTDYMAIGGGQAEAPRGFTIVQLPLRPGVDIIESSLGRSLPGNGNVAMAAQATGSGPAFAAGPAADTVPSNGTVTAQISGALQAHAELTRELERALIEQQAYSDELREELEQIRDRIDSTEGARQELTVKAEALQDELKAWRNRAALAEGEVMRLKLARGEQPGEGELGALRAELADTKQRLERVAVHWKEAEARTESVARRIAELEAEVARERQRATTVVAEARSQFDQELARAVEQAREQGAAQAAQKDTDDLRSKLSAAEEQLRQHEQRTQSATAELEQLRRDRDEQANRAEAAEAARAEAEHELRELRATLAERGTESGATESSRRKPRSRKKPAASEVSAELPLPATLPGFETERARAAEDVNPASEAPADETADTETPPHDSES
jgi:SAM-dependent methyltransferase